MKTEPLKFTAGISMSAEYGELSEGKVFATRLTIVGLPTAEMADRMAEWMYALMEKNLTQAMIDCAPEGCQLVGMEKEPNSEEGSKH
jgi:hypothetical protein